MPAAELLFFLGFQALIHGSNHRAQVLLRQMGVAFGHCHGLVPQDFCNLAGAGAGHGQQAACRMAQIMEAEVIQTSALAAGFPCLANLDGLVVHGVAREQQ